MIINSYISDFSNRLHFTESLSDILTKENKKSVVFECSLSHVTLSVLWTFRESSNQSSVKLENSEKHQISSEGCRQFLRICSIKQSDAGYYCCNASDNEEQVETSARLVVAGKYFSNNY